MKIGLLLLGLVLGIQASFSQSNSKQNCSSPSSEIDDLNVITKCSIEQVKENGKHGKKTVLNISAKKRTNNYRIVRKKEKVNSVKTTTLLNDVKHKSGVVFEKRIISVSNKLKVNKVLFSIVDEIPLFSRCINTEENNKKTCFNQEISKHFAKHFYPENVSDYNNIKRVFIQFSINIRGDVYDIGIKAKQKSPSLQKEIRRVINKLPKFISGKHEGLPVDVTYSLPINLNFD